MATVTESVVEDAGFAWMQELRGTDFTVCWSTERLACWLRPSRSGSKALSIQAEFRRTRSLVLEAE